MLKHGKCEFRPYIHSSKSAYGLYKGASIELSVILVMLNWHGIPHWDVPRAPEDAVPPYSEFLSQDMRIEELQVSLSFPISSNSSLCLHLEIREKWLSDGGWRSPVSVSQGFIAPCLLLLILNFVTSDITRSLFEELCLYFEILKRFFMCGNSGQQN